MIKKERFKYIIEYFSTHHPVAETELNYNTPYELLVAVILSAQCTDKRVNQITPIFFKKFPNAKALQNAKINEVFELIKTCSYPNNKSKYLIGMAKMLIKKFNGIIPDQLSELQKLPGVGRKTANVISSIVYNKPAMPVDTHIFRVSERLGLTTNSKNPYHTEMQLIKYIPEEKISIAHHWLILHGRYVCKAKKPKCHDCGLKNICRYYKKNKF